MTNLPDEGASRQEFGGAEQWRDLDILDQKRILEQMTGFNCPMTDEALLEEQKKGFCLSDVGLSFRKAPWADSIKEPPPEARGGTPTIREFLFQLEPNFSRLPTDSGVNINFEGGRVRVSEGIEDVRDSLGVALVRRLPTSDGAGESSVSPSVMHNDRERMQQTISLLHETASQRLVAGGSDKLNSLDSQLMSLGEAVDAGRAGSNLEATLLAIEKKIRALVAPK